jgi:hydrogenase maturation protein HypF
MKKNYIIRVKGTVQGVGFRPFIYRLAKEYSLKGHVLNDTEGVLIEAESDQEILNKFMDDIKSKLPELATINELNFKESGIKNFTSFTIEKSRQSENKTAFYSPDTAVCGECLSEYNDPSDRRYLYPFITCINCGPRFSIVNDIPYDRKNTTMNIFKMCPACEAEYSDPENRRFHSQPNACPECGPLLTLKKNSGEIIAEGYKDIAYRTSELILAGNIVAIKGIGGYHLAADAKNSKAVEELRMRKRRPFKPFALMVSSYASALKYTNINDIEKKLLTSKERPIVLLKTKNFTDITPEAAPGLSYLGFMVPYTPFQYSLFTGRMDSVFIMTSGNITDEPIIYRDDDAEKNLGSIADYVVSYNREILAQSDDSVLFVEKGKPFFVRRARGYVPSPLISDHSGKKILAMGGDLKNNFAISKNNSIIISQYLGDMADIETHMAFKNTVDHYIKVFDSKPDVIVSDMHPGYMTTQFADELAGESISRISVQHHHAHIASVLEDHRLDEEVIGLAFDGTGYGTDGNLWGSEFLIADRRNFYRKARFSYFPLPGGDSAIKEVWKTGVSLMYLAQKKILTGYFDSYNATAVTEMIDKKINSPLTCSIGRIFDAVSSILGISMVVSSEAEAAILLEEAAMKAPFPENKYIIPYSVENEIIISSESIINKIIDLDEISSDKSMIAQFFHKAIADTSIEISDIIRKKTGLNKIVLSGGAFHNRLLLKYIVSGLDTMGFEIFLPENIPFNDGCISLGQICISKKILSDNKN